MSTKKKKKKKHGKKTFMKFPSCHKECLQQELSSDVSLTDTSECWLIGAIA